MNTSLDIDLGVIPESYLERKVYSDHFHVHPLNESVILQIHKNNKHFNISDPFVTYITHLESNISPKLILLENRVKSG